MKRYHYILTVTLDGGVNAIREQMVEGTIMLEEGSSRWEAYRKIAGKLDDPGKFVVEFFSLEPDEM